MFEIHPATTRRTRGWLDTHIQTYVIEVFYYKLRNIFLGTKLA